MNGLVLCINNLFLLLFLLHVQIYDDDKHKIFRSDSVILVACSMFE